MIYPEKRSEKWLYKKSLSEFDKFFFLVIIISTNQKTVYSFIRFIMKIFSHMHDHLLKHPHKYLGLAVFCKVMLVGLLAVPVIQLIQNTYAATTYTITTSA
jgi:hypothetical protein